MAATAEDWVRVLGLSEHPEGGYYREVYRSADVLSAEQLPQRYGAPRSLGTSIYYLLRAGDRSRFHRLRSDEIWHYHAGGSAMLHMLREDGRYERCAVGSDVSAGEMPQVIIPRGCWFGATVQKGDFVLVGCTVFPGFDFTDFELARRDELMARYPAHRDVIELLCPRQG